VEVRKTKFLGSVDEEGWKTVISEPRKMKNGVVITLHPDVQVYHDGSDGYNVSCPECQEEIFIGDELPYGGPDDPLEGTCDHCGTEVTVEAYLDVRVDNVRARTPSAKKEAEDEELVVLDGIDMDSLGLPDDHPLRGED
jgi:hypothetical protein